MPNAADIKPSDNLVCLVVGHAGSGKSSALASFATKDEPMYVFDIDHRIKGIYPSKDWLGESLNYIDYDQFDTRDGFASIQKKFEIFWNQYQKREFKYKSIVIDSVGSLAEMFLIDSQILKGAKPGMDLSKLTKDQTKGMKILGNIAFPVPDDYHYGKRAFHILFYNYFTEFPKCNIFLSGWTTERWGKDPENPYAPEILLPGKKLLATSKLAGELPGYFDEVWEFDKEETGASSRPVQFTVRFNSFLAKTSLPQLAKAGKIDITGKNFKRVFDELVSKDKEKGKVA